MRENLLIFYPIIMGIKLKYYAISLKISKNGLDQPKVCPAK